TITPASTLAASAQYTGDVRTGGTDAAGNALAANHQFSFTTADPSAPRFGYDQVGGALDSGDMNFMNGSRFVNGPTPLALPPPPPRADDQPALRLPQDGAGRAGQPVPGGGLRRRERLAGRAGGVE